MNVAVVVAHWPRIGGHRVKRHFDKADTDGDGLLNYREVRTLMDYTCNDAPMMSHIRLHLPVVMRQLRETDSYEVQKIAMKNNVKSEKAITSFVSK